MNIDLSRFDEKIRRMEKWRNLLAEMLADPAGSQILYELVSPNGSKTATDSAVVVRTPRKLTKKAKIEAAVLRVSETFSQPFGSHELVDLLKKENFNFSRDPMIETGSALRRLIRDTRIRVVREKSGRIGRLYERVLP